MLSIVAVRPAIEPAFLDRGEVVGYQVRADFIALINDRPELAGRWLPAQSRRVSDARRIDAAGRRLHIDFEHGCTSVFDIQAVFSYVAVGTDPDVELLAIMAGQQCLRPVMVNGTGQVRKLHAGVGHARLAWRVMIFHDVVGIRDI